MGKWTRKIFRQGTSKAITLPQALLDGRGWKQGDEIEITESNGDVVLRKVIKK